MKYTSLLTALSAVLATAAMADTPLLLNLDFNDPEADAPTDPWIASADAYSDPGRNNYGYWTQLGVADQVADNGDGSYTLSSWDEDETMSAFSTFVLQEYLAGPPGAFANTTFATGDVIRFEGEAFSTQTGPNTDDVITRAFIKVLGYTNNQAYQTKMEYSDFMDITPGDYQTIDLEVTFPDLTVDDSLQVLQIGFETVTAWDSSASGGAGAMDTATITFRNLNAYIVGSAAEWEGYPVDENGYADTGDLMGIVYTGDAPWIYSYSLESWLYIPEGSMVENGLWVYSPK